MSTPTWTDAAAADGIPENDVVGLVVDGRDIAFYRTEGGFFATDNLCTHGQARLCDGFLNGFEIECPLHQGRFDVRDGSAICAPVTAAVRSYPVRIEGGRVFVQLSRAGSSSR